mmetsp:Transcript_16483/g.40258  ORF Transcript_16483/g.40258 Transcript_16483/m.40258 type:complete len:124 (+) Transcript_16483:178-549(+)
MLLYGSHKMETQYGGVILQVANDSFSHSVIMTSLRPAKNKKWRSQLVCKACMYRFQRVPPVILAFVACLSSTSQSGKDLPENSTVPSVYPSPVEACIEAFQVPTCPLWHQESAGNFQMASTLL